MSAVDLTFVTPRYGADVIGGAETGARSLATRLAADGRTVSVLTSCARSHVTWDDSFTPGSTEEDGVTVHRFPVDRTRAPDFDARSAALFAAPAAVRRSDALAWIDDQGPTSTALLDAVAGVDTGLLVFYPYLYHPTVRGVPLARVPTLMYPAAHEEPPLHLPVFDDVFDAVDGFAFHSRAEQALVARRFPATLTVPQAPVGLPVDPPPPVDVDAVRSRFGLGDEPVALCLGRVDAGKGTHELAGWFAERRARGGRGRLLLVGPVVGAPPVADGVSVLGPVSELDKYGLLAAADVLVNPSAHESFSIVVLEAWWAGTPVLVNGWCGPTTEHCRASGGGLTYLGIAEFSAALDRLLDDDPLRARLAEAGRRYVEATFTWPAVRRRLDGLLARVAART